MRRVLRAAGRLRRAGAARRARRRAHPRYGAAPRGLPRVPRGVREPAGAGRRRRGVRVGGGGARTGANPPTLSKEDPMTSAVAALRPTPVPSSSALRADPVAQATLLLRIAFTVAPILFGLDKFANVLTDDWTRYLAPAFNDVVAGWLGGIIVNLLVVGGYGDIALRDFGLLLGALTLARLASAPPR